jgi:hypothetical protein
LFLIRIEKGAPVNDERRDQEREPNFRNVELVITGPSGIEVGFPVILRDAGRNGLGGVYVGQDLFIPEGDALLKDEDADKMVRVVWTKKVAEYVQILGLEIA